MAMMTGITIVALLFYLVFLAGMIFLMGFGLWKMSKNAGIPHAWTSFLYPLYNMGLLAERSLYAHTGRQKPLAKWSLWLIIAIAAVVLLLLVGTVAAMASGFMAVNLFSAILIFPLTIAGAVLTYYDLYYIYKDYSPGNEVVLLVVSILCGAYPIIFLVVMNVVPVSVAGRCPYGQPKYNRPYQGPQDPGGQPPCGGPEYR